MKYHIYYGDFLLLLIIFGVQDVQLRTLFASFAASATGCGARRIFRMIMKHAYSAVYLNTNSACVTNCFGNE